MKNNLKALRGHFNESQMAISLYLEISIELYDLKENGFSDSNTFHSTENHWYYHISILWK